MRCHFNHLLPTSLLATRINTKLAMVRREACWVKPLQEHSAVHIRSYGPWSQTCRATSPASHFSHEASEPAVAYCQAVPARLHTLW